MNPPRYPFPRVFRLVSRTKAMSLLVNLCLSVLIVEHCFIMFHKKREKENESKKSDDQETRGGCSEIVVAFEDDRTRLPSPFSTLETSHPRRRDHTTEGCESRINTQRRHPPIETCEWTTLECLASTSFAHTLCHLPSWRKHACVAESGEPPIHVCSVFYPFSRGYCSQPREFQTSQLIGLNVTKRKR